MGKGKVVNKQRVASIRAQMDHAQMMYDQITGEKGRIRWRLKIRELTEELEECGELTPK